MNAHAAQADRLEALARRPLQPHRDLLLHLAARLRALEALEATEPGAQLSFDREWRSAA